MTGRKTNWRWRWRPYLSVSSPWTPFSACRHQHRQLGKYSLNWTSSIRDRPPLLWQLRYCAICVEKIFYAIHCRVIGVSRGWVAGRCRLHIQPFVTFKINLQRTGSMYITLLAPLATQNRPAGQRLVRPRTLATAATLFHGWSIGARRTTRSSDTKYTRLNTGSRECSCRKQILGVYYNACYSTTRSRELRATMCRDKATVSVDNSPTSPRRVSSINSNHNNLGR